MASYKTSLSFGLVYIPVSLKAVARSHDIGFNLLERSTGKRVRNKRVAEGTDREVPMSETVRGYAYEKDRYVVFEDEDFEKIKTVNDKAVNITSFADLKDIDPIYYEKTYYVRPEGGERAFALLHKAMLEMKKVGISKTVLGSKECLVVVRAEKNAMLLSTLYFADEITDAPKLPEQKTDAREKELAVTMINSMCEKFAPLKYRNEYNDRLRAAIEDKISGSETVTPPKAEAAKSGSLLDALLASVENLSKPQPRA